MSGRFVGFVLKRLEHVCELFFDGWFAVSPFDGSKGVPGLLHDEFGISHPHPVDVGYADVLPFFGYPPARTARKEEQERGGRDPVSCRAERPAFGETVCVDLASYGKNPTTARTSS